MSAINFKSAASNFMNGGGHTAEGHNAGYSVVAREVAGHCPAEGILHLMKPATRQVLAWERERTMQP